MLGWKLTTAARLANRWASQRQEHPGEVGDEGRQGARRGVRTGQKGGKQTERVGVAEAETGRSQYLQT